MPTAQDNRMKMLDELTTDSARSPSASAKWKQESRGSKRVLKISWPSKASALCPDTAMPPKRAEATCHRHREARYQTAD